MTAKVQEGAREASDTITSLVAMMQTPAAQSFAVSQRLALETARFWARRMHAYADQMEALAACTRPEDIAAAQQRFIERMRDDYAAESEALSALLAPVKPHHRRARRANGEQAEA